MKLSVSLTDENVFANRAGMDSRSAVLQQAIATLKAADLTDDHERAFNEWHDIGEGVIWDAGS
jgi:hypothetical protein